MENIQDEIFARVSQAVTIQREEFIKSKFKAKGYDLLPTENCRFPKFNVSKCGEWSYFFADNGTRQGEFIVAIKDEEYKYSTAEPYSVLGTISFDWQDTSFEPVRIL